MYPNGPWGPESHIQRGGVVYDFMVPGDPLTPGWPSLPGARRIERADAVSLPAIISAPLSYKDARVLLAADSPVVRVVVRLGRPDPPDLDGDRDDSRHPNPEQSSLSATIATHGFTAASIHRADPQR